jgi:hypothetical protein
MQRCSETPLDPEVLEDGHIVTCRQQLNSNVIVVESGFTFAPGNTETQKRNSLLGR